MKNLLTFIFCIFLSICSLLATAQTKSVISGPWVGNIELRNATVWAEVATHVKKVQVKYRSQGKNNIDNIIDYNGPLGKDFNPVKIELNGLDINTIYTYTLVVDGKPYQSKFKNTFATKDLWQYRKPAPDFNFLAGSCSYFNEPIYDRPGKPYGQDSSIFISMANTPAAFNLWLGDSWYLREVDYFTDWGLKYRASRDRSHEVVQRFMAALPHYFIWDDHDFGPNNSGRSYIFRKESREVFKNFTLNPSYGEDGEGIYTKVSYSDADFFLTDGRYFRSEPWISDSINGKENAQKQFLGPKQMDWLKNALLNSRAIFKIIVSGSQVLNSSSNQDCMRAYKREFAELMDFLATQKISGVIFMSGDRHHSEILRQERDGLYPLYDITISPLTSGVSTERPNEKVNPQRVPGSLLRVQNFGNISISGPRNNRSLKVDFRGLKGELLYSWEIGEKQLKVNL